MLSRRNVRIKILQVLYAHQKDESPSYQTVLKDYRAAVDRSFELFLFNLCWLLKVAEHAHQDGERRKQKHVPTEEDKQFTPRLYRNELVQLLIFQPWLIREFSKRAIEGRIDPDDERRLYNNFAKTPEYLAYLKLEQPAGDDHLQILLKLYKWLTDDEHFVDLMEMQYPTWPDDESLVIGTMKKVIKAVAVPFEWLQPVDPAYPEKVQLKDAFFDPYKPSAETCTEFGELLLDKVFNEEKQLMEMIRPALDNWDADRVAMIDMILLKMALTELIIFPTIPPKVTLNEYLEIAKLYSTDKSKEFINGILDNLLKKLREEGKIKKEGRGLMD
jgi:N utilization substance protein B